MTELEKVLMMAIESEKEAGKAYHEAAAKTTNPNNKQVYMWLAREELGHQTLLNAELNPRKNFIFRVKVINYFSWINGIL